MDNLLGKKLIGIKNSYLGLKATVVGTTTHLSETEYIIIYDEHRPAKSQLHKSHVVYMSGEFYGAKEDFLGKSYNTGNYNQVLNYFRVITKFYPNTSLFRKLYPNGKEVNNLWEV